MLKLEVSIYDEELERCCDGKEFIELVKEAAVDQLASQLIDGEAYDQAEELLKDAIKLHKPEIIDAVVKEVTKGVTEKILRQKAIIAATPKASELKAINRENEQYFGELIDKAIAKRFK